MVSLCESPSWFSARVSLPKSLKLKGRLFAFPGAATSLAALAGCGRDMFEAQPLGAQLISHQINTLERQSLLAGFWRAQAQSC